MEYVRTVDLAALAAAGTQARINQALLDRDSGAEACSVSYIQVPPGSGSPAGRHYHVFDQFYYVLSGTMGVEIDGQEFETGPGALVLLPATVPHRNWNSGAELLVHLAIMVPVPDPTQPFAITVAD